MKKIRSNPHTVSSIAELKPGSAAVYRPDAETESPVEERLYVRGDEFFIDLVRDINAAVREVQLETYIFELDAVGRAFIAAMSHAHQRGVRVRFLVDGVGLPLAGGRLLAALEESGFPFRIFHPIPWFFRHWRHMAGGRAVPPQFLQLLTRLNNRNHRKVCTIDRRIAWIGSFNVSALHLPVAHGGEEWRDTAVRIENIDTRPLEQAFRRAWNPWRWHPLRHRTSLRSPFRLNDTRRQRRARTRELLRRIGRSKRRIWITNAYFVPDERLLHEINRAAKRGVDVRIILPSISDIFFMPWTSATFYGSLLDHGVKIYEYQPGVLHAKTIIIDEWMTVGSSNMNSRSLRHDLEVDYVLRQAGTKAALASAFLRDLKHSKEISPEAYPNRPLWQRFLAHLVLFAKYWI
ncbi:MAG: phospholipase D-like domain-containing protein [Methylocaldum sp.]|nr:phospholipase D-like domain-containing protein [Methylocaldum sp.]